MGKHGLEIVKLLVDAGADIDKGDGKDGWTPLTHASTVCSIELVDYLIKEAGSNIECGESVSALVDHQLQVSLFWNDY